MPDSPAYLEWLVDTGLRWTTFEGKTIEVWELRHQMTEDTLKEWATHLRSHYCDVDEIDVLREGTSFSRAEYLEQIKLPDHQSGLGPSIRAGDFGEILIADYLEHKLAFWVPRTRYGNKAVRNESVKGADVIGFRFNNDGVEKADTLAIYEVKTQLSGTTTTGRLQDAIDGSSKDELRRAESLNAIKQRLLRVVNLPTQAE
ncbi:MAG: Hachiman antiphage defense system protein HamA [Pyrinomonadaceae bacterium]